MLPYAHSCIVQTSLSHIDMLRLYRSANAYISPFRSEGFGLGTLEAMALGLQACYQSFTVSADLLDIPHAHLRMTVVRFPCFLIDVYSPAGELNVRVRHSTQYTMQLPERSISEGLACFMISTR